jgi:hypothetical protein
MEPEPEDPDQAVRAERLKTAETSVHDIVGARTCKQSSFELYTSLNSLYRDAKEPGSVTVSSNSLKEMRDHAKQINRGISQFTRAVCGEFFRLGTEQNALKHEMHLDILDREAAFTETLEAIVAADGDASIQSSLSSALRVVKNSHVAMLSLKEESVFESESAEECARLRGGA